MSGLILDNYDSFTHNLYQLFGSLSAAPAVARNDEISLDRVRQLDPDFIVISPGPGRPDDPAYFGVCADVIRILGATTPILGVCLGHQGIAHVLGGKVVRAAETMHGKTSYVFHDGHALFADVPRAFEAMRYHSLIAEPASLPAELEVTAKTWDGTIMAVRHRHWPMFGVQFHPESIGTPSGKLIARNFLKLAAEAKSHGARSASNY